MSAVRLFFLGLIYFYQLLSPVVHSVSQIFSVQMGCKYPETCSNYVARKIKEEALLRVALNKSFRRLLSCGPWASYRAWFS